MALSSASKRASTAVSRALRRWDHGENLDMSETILEGQI
jgi:hypothetical protein